MARSPRRRFPMGEAVCAECGGGFPERKLKELVRGRGKWVCPGCLEKLTKAPAAAKKAQVAIREAMGEKKEAKVDG